MADQARPKPAPDASPSLAPHTLTTPRQRQLAARIRVLEQQARAPKAGKEEGERTEAVFE